MQVGAVDHEHVIGTAPRSPGGFDHAAHRVRMILVARESQSPNLWSACVAALIHFPQRELQLVVERIGVREQLEPARVFLQLIEHCEQCRITRVRPAGTCALLAGDRDRRQLDRETP